MVGQEDSKGMPVYGAGSGFGRANSAVKYNGRYMNGGGIFGVGSVDPETGKGGKRAHDIDPQQQPLADTLPTNAMQHHLVIALSE